MSEKKKKKLVPELRFPEFKEKEGWVSKILSKVSYVNPSSGELPEQFIYIDLKSVDSGKLVKKQIVESREAPSRAQRLLEPGDVIYQTVRPYQKNNYYFDSQDDFAYVASTGYAQLRAHQSKKFLYHYIHSTNFVSRVLKKCTGSNYPAIKSSDLGRVVVELPSPDEQLKVAACLSSLDDLITAHSDKLKALRNHKQGLLQQLFPQAGAGVPELRFKEFEGEWAEKVLGKIAGFSKGKGISKANISEDGILPCIRYGELYTLYNERIEIVKSRTNLSTDHLVLSEANDVILPSSGETQIDIATASCVMRSGIALGGDLNIIKTSVDGVFLAYYLNGVLKMAIASMSQGISVIHLYAKQLKKLKLRIPKKEEQQKIVSCLSAVDDLIAAQAEKITQLQLHKEGLMQGLFPKIENQA